MHPRFNVEQMLRHIETDRITVEMAVAPIALAIASHPGLESYDLSSLRYIMWGATPVTASIADVTSLSKAPVRQLYIRETSEFWLHERVRDALIATRPVYLNIRPETWYHGSGGLEALGIFLRASLGLEGRLRCLEVTVTCYTPLEAPLVWVVRPNALTRRGT